MTALLTTLFEAFWRAAFAACLEHLPQIRDALTPQARDAADDAARQQVLLDARQADVDRGDLPPDQVGR